MDISKRTEDIVHTFIKDFPACIAKSLELTSRFNDIKHSDMHVIRQLEELTAVITFESIALKRYEEQMSESDVITESDVDELKKEKYDNERADMQTNTM